jgi:D-glycero-D-manno-heptose 1,7-bisphosphate phosphatase
MSATLAAPSHSRGTASAAHPVEAVFLDRDGVINDNRLDYVKTWSEFQFLPGAVDAIRRMCRAGCRVFVISNQAVIGRGLVSHHVVDTVNGLMLRDLDHVGAHVEAVAYCPHRPDQDCPCRKPRPALLLKLAFGHGVNLKHSVLIGDALSDLEAGTAVGCETILVLSGRGREQYARAQAQGKRDIVVAKDLVEASELVLAKMGRRYRPKRTVEGKQFS